MSNLRDKNTQVKEDISITRKLKFEKLVSLISSRFVGNYELDKVTNKSLADMGEFIHARRVFIFLFDKEKLYMRNTHEWYNVNAESHINDYKHLEMKDVPWVIKQLLKGNPIVIEDVSRLPPEAKNIKNLLKNHGVKSNLTIPLYINGEIGGFIGFDDDLESRNWVEEDLNLLQISSRIIGNAIERKLTEDILKESEEKYRLITENVSDLIAVLNSKYEHEYINENTYQRVLGYNYQDMLGKTRHDIIHPDDYKSAIKILKDGFKKGEGRGELRLRHKNGIYIWVETVGRIFKDSEKNIKAITVSRDITDRKRAEHKLKKSLETTKNILKSLPIGIVMMGYDKKVRSINAKALDILNTASEDEIIGEICYKNICPIEVDSCPIIDLGKKVHYIESSILDRKGNKVPILKTVQTITLGGENLLLEAFMDISELKKTEKKLRYSEEKYRSVLKNINEGYYEVDINGDIIFFNKALCRILGYSGGELMSMNYHQLFDEETRNRIFLVYNDLFNKGEGFALLEYPIIRKDGKIEYLESSVYLIYGSNGDIIGFKGFIRDVSERKRAEALRKKFSQELEKEVELRTKELKVALDYQKLYLDQILKASNFKTEFLATMSHELRTPLNAIIGFTDLLLDGVYGRLNSEQLEYIKDIEESSKHLLDMIIHILDISKIESGQVTVKIDKIQLYSIVEQVISTLKPFYTKKDLKIELRGLKKSQIIYADPLKLKQIIYNLLSNAIKFTENGMITFKFLDKKYNWEFYIKDTGIGIAKKDYEIIFEDFRRVKSPYIDSIPGSGLGLSLTKRIINLHGGKISFTSKLGKGSTFSFFIPKNIKNVDSRLRVENLLKSI